jgi:hypothetical protein
MLTRGQPGLDREAAMRILEHTQELQRRHGRLLEIARRAGHTSVSFCLDRYGHLLAGAEDALADRLEELARPNPASARVVALR